MAFSTDLLGIKKIEMNMPSRYIYKMFQIDTNRINAKQGLENMNTLERWHKNGVIKLEMSEPSLSEACAGNNRERRRKAHCYIFSMSFAEIPEEKARLQKIEQILFPKGVKDQSQKNDVEIVFNAAKYGQILITNDGGSKTQPGGLLGNAQKLKEEIGVTVVTDEQAIGMVRKDIEIRDQMARDEAKESGLKLPDWVGKD
jgi:hypothetical protein